MERWVHTRAFASVLGPRGRASLDAPLHGAKSSLDDDVPTPRLGRGVEPVTEGTVSDASHSPLRCEPTMTIPRTFTSYVSGYGESAVPTLSASERSSIDVSERTLHAPASALHNHRPLASRPPPKRSFSSYRAWMQVGTQCTDCH